MSLRLILLRHAETLWNRERRYQGWQDVPLSDEGRAQAQAVAQLLARERLDAVWSSPLARAYDTAAAIAAPHGLAVQTDDAFGEMRFGEWEGRTVTEIEARDPEGRRLWVESPHLAAPPGGETLVEVQTRVLAGLDALRGVHAGQTVCLVAHGISSRMLILEALGLPLERLWAIQLSPTGISELEFRDDWTTLHRMNTLRHLETIPAR